MKKIRFQLLILLMLSNVGTAQIVNYDFSINHQPKVKQYWEIYNKVLVQSNFNAPSDTMQKYLLQMFTLIEPFNEHISVLAWTYHDQKDYKNAVKYYYQAVAKGYLPYCKYTQIEFITDNDSVAEYKVVQKQLDSLKINVHCAMDIPFCNLVIALFEIDQMTRNAHYFKQEENKKDQAFEVIKYVAYYDSITLKRLLSHIDRYGIPHQNLMTNEAYEAFLILVHHQVQYLDGVENKRLFTLVKTAIEDGRMKHTFLRAAIDYMHWRNNGQFFGTVSQANGEGKYELNPPLINPETVAERRAAWLFEPLELQMRNAYGTGNYILPKGYK